MGEQDLSRLTIDKQRAGFRPARPKSLRLIAVIVLILVLALSVGLFFKPALTVETVTVSQVYPSQALTVLNASGYVVAQRKAAVAPKTTGQLEWLGVEEGSRVRKGQLMARLENRDTTASRNLALANLASAKANLDQAMAEFTDASRSFKRIGELLAEGIVAQADFDSAEARLNRALALRAGMSAGVRSSAAALAGADAALDYTMIRAPFDAVVLTKNADVGDIVTPIGAAANAKAAVVTIADLRSVQVEADVSESNLAKIKVGQPCEIQLDALPDLRFRGRLLIIVPTADRSKASVMVKVGFMEIDQRILPEMSAKVAFLERAVTPSEQRPMTAVPLGALVNEGGKKYLFLLKGERVQRVPVVPGSGGGDLVEIVSGVKAGETIVIRPSSKLADGMKVKLAEKK